MIAVKTRADFLALLRRWWIVPVTLLAGGLVLLARQQPMLTERLYSSGVYRLLAGVFGRLTSLVPFSMMELLICAAIAAIVAMLFYEGRRWLTLRRDRKLPREKGNPLYTLERGVKAACYVLCAFVLLCGLNYYRPEFTVFSGLTVRDSTTEELILLCESLAAEASGLREAVAVDENGVTKLSGSAFSAAHQARDAFAELAQQYEVLPDMGIVPKPIVNSWWMSMTQITGFFSPYTYEANVNIAAPAYSIPATMCHELAHTRGFMREDEANFIGCLACRESDVPEFRYSGVMLALVHSINRLYETDQAAAQRINEQMSEGVRRDFAANNAYWARFEGPVAEVSTAVNNAYLRVNNQSDGVRSYGRMVDLLLAEQREGSPAAGSSPRCDAESF